MMTGLLFVLCLIVLLVMASISSARAQALKLQKWKDWNAASPLHYPDEYWMQYEAPEDAGWSSKKLSSIEKHSNSTDSAAVMVIHNGAVLTQWGQTSRRYKCHSIRKSILSALYGIAVQDGYINIGDTIGSLGIDDNSPLTEIEKTAKVSDLLKARSGIYHPAAFETRSMKKNRPKRGSHSPGTHWFYNNWDFNALATIYNENTPAGLFRSFEQKVATPLQMQDFELRHTYYHLEPQNSCHAGYPFRMSARDLARFGLLFLNQGRWQENQILPPEWVGESTASHTVHSKGGYGYMWWTLPEKGPLGKLGTYAAVGHGGHAIYVVPAANLVLVHRSNTYDGEKKKVRSAAIRNILMQVLKARTGPPSPQPKLIPLESKEPSTQEKKISETQIAAFSGEYSKGESVATVQNTEGQLEITHPNWGNYFLLPKTDTEFEIEDAQKQIEFELDPSGVATAIRIWFSPEEPYEMQRTR